MYAALMAGVGNYLCQNFGYQPGQVLYGGTDDFWNRQALNRVKTPGLVYGSTSVSFPSGFSAHGNQYLGDVNSSENAVLTVKPVRFQATLTVGLIADNENDHFEQIHKYVEMAALNACLRYRVRIPDLSFEEEWDSTVSEFSELSPAPGGRESNTWDTEGLSYKLEATFTVNSMFLFTEEKKLVRCIFVNGAKLGDNQSLAGIIGADSSGNKFPKTRK